MLLMDKISNDKGKRGFTYSTPEKLVTEKI